MLQWFQQRYPRVTDRTIRQHLRAFSANDGTKKYMPSLPKDVLFKMGRGQYRSYDPDNDGLFDERGRPIGSEDDEVDPEDSEETAEEALEFPLELHLEEFMAKNWGRIGFGRPLKLYEGADGRSGRQFATGTGNIDFLCQDTASGDLVVIELKKGRSSDRVLGQCQRYMGWVQSNLTSPNQKVHGLIVAPDLDERLRYALMVAPNIDLLCYRVDFQLFAPPEGPSV
ncbi:MAG: endonuclease NucS domain-containing protein [Dehalococcoidia bacterium]